jgi:hypothetical protein
MLLQNILAGPHQVLQNVAPGTSDATRSCHPGLSNDMISQTNLLCLGQIFLLHKLWYGFARHPSHFQAERKSSQISIPLIHSNVKTLK